MLAQVVINLELKNIWVKDKIRFRNRVLKCTSGQQMELVVV